MPASTTSEMKLTAAAISDLELPAPVGDLRRIELLEKLCNSRDDDTGGNKISLGGFSFVHELDARARPPDELVIGLDPHPTTAEKKAKYYFVIQAKHRGENRRSTNGCRWRTETGRTEVRRGEDVVGDVHRLSYSNMTGSRHKSQHWVMMEYTLANHHDGGNQSSFVLSVVHNSGYNNKRRKAAVAASSDSGARVAPAGRTVEAADQYYGRHQIRDGVVEAREGQKTATSINKEPQVDKSITTAGDKRPGYATTSAANLNKFGGKEAHQSILTNMAFKLNTTILEIVSEGVLGERDFEKKELGNIVSELQKFAHVTIVQQRSIISLSLTGTEENSKLILSKLSNALSEIGANWQQDCRESEGQLSSVVVNDSDAKRCVEAIKSAFSAEKSSSGSGSGSKRKVAEEEDHPEAPPAGRRQTINPPTPSSVLQQTNEEVQPGADVEFNSYNELDMNYPWWDEYYTGAHDHPPTGRRQTNPPTRSDDEEVQLGADMEFNSNCPVPVNSSSSTAVTHPESPQEMTDTGGLLTEEETQISADQDLNNEAELPTEVMGFADFANPAYETWWPTEDGPPILLDHDEEYPDLEIGDLW